MITEVDQEPGRGRRQRREWFEIQNVSATDIDIDGWTISDGGADSH